jgi:hypothetical protein
MRVSMPRWWIVQFRAWGKPTRLAADEWERLYVFATPGLAETFCQRLSEKAIAAAAVPVTPPQVRDILNENGVDDEELDQHYVIVEARTVSASDARAHVLEEADRFCKAQMLRAAGVSQDAIADTLGG